MVLSLWPHRVAIYAKNYVVLRRLAFSLPQSITP